MRSPTVLKRLVPTAVLVRLVPTPRPMRLVRTAPPRTLLILLISASLWALTPANVRADLSDKDARKAIQTMFGASLPSSAVRIQQVRSGAEGVAEVTAEIQGVFRARQADGHWRLREIRTGQDTWEQLETIAQALAVQLPSGGCDDPSLFVSRNAGASALTVKRSRCLVAELLGVTLPSDQVRIKELSALNLPLGSESSALITAFIQVDLRLTPDNRGWRVSEFKSGTRAWTMIGTLSSALNETKRVNATHDLTAIASALVEYRRERGAFVVSDKESVLIDHLNPRYLTRVIRVDPWHRAYEYEGAQDRFSLRSVGPDGKSGTADDIVVSGP
jgi:hypothetical protein